MQVLKSILAIGIMGLVLLIFSGNPSPSVANGLTPSPSFSTNEQIPSAQSGEQGPRVRRSAPPVSFDGDVRRLPQLRQPAQRPAPLPARRKPGTTAQSSPSSTLLDPVRQPSMRGVRSLNPGIGFDGLDFATWGYGWPPDPNGDVGPAHYIQTVNTSIGIYSKSGTPLATFTLNSFFSAASSPCNAYNQGDPIVLYDPVSGRWIISDFSWLPYQIDSGPYYECIGVSKTSDPVSGGWWLYTFEADPTMLNDYPKLGVWSDGIYMSASMWDLYSNGYGGTWMGTRLWALDRNDMINGLPIDSVSFYLPASTGYHILLPSNLRGASPPSGTPAFFASVDQPSTLHLWKFHVDWDYPDHSWFVHSADLTTASFKMPCAAANILSCVPQLNGEYVDGLGDRLMMQLQYRNLNGTESLWANHTVAYSDAQDLPLGVRWYEIRNPNYAPSIYQQGTFRPDSDSRWMGSLAVDRDGNMALGYSVSSASMYPAIRYTGRFITDTLGTLLPESTLIQGTGSQSGGYARWGDYSAMTVDPTDDCTFWYTNQYYVTTGNNWHTSIGSFKFPTCTQKYYFPLVINEATP